MLIGIIFILGIIAFFVFVPLLIFRVAGYIRSNAMRKLAKKYDLEFDENSEKVPFFNLDVFGSKMHGVRNKIRGKVNNHSIEIFDRHDINPIGYSGSPMTTRSTIISIDFVQNKRGITTVRKLNKILSNLKYKDIVYRKSNWYWKFKYNQKLNKIALIVIMIFFAIGIAFMTRFLILDIISVK